jgi:ankyrin repeat protein
MAPHPLPARPSVASLRKQAKQLKKSFEHGEPDAVARAEAILGRSTVTLALRDAQRIIAVEYGFASWRELRAAIAAALAAAAEESEKQPAALADEFLDLACLRYAYGVGDSPGSARRAERLLLQRPELATHSAHVLAALGDAQALGERLAADPRLVREKGGPRDWPPLLYLTYSRVPQRDALGAAQVLLSHGADPNAHYFSPPPDGPYKYTALTGVFGLGEAGRLAQPPHAERDALARVLLEAGADPNDGQTVYQCHFEPDNSHLELLFSYGMDPASLGWSLATAAGQGYRARVQLMLAHGVDPDATQAPHSQRTAYELALVYGYPDIAQDLVSAGARPSELSREDTFQAACLAGDREAARQLLAAHPELLDWRLLVTAAGRGSLEGIETLLELGLTPNPEDIHAVTALHQAAFSGHREIVMKLLSRGAEVDRRERNHWSTAAGWARYAGQKDVALILAARSNDLFEVINHGHLERLRELLDQDPRAIGSRDGNGQTVLHRVDVDLPNAKEVAELLLDRGAPFQASADATAGTVETASSETPLARFVRLGADDLADLLIERGASE